MKKKLLSLILSAALLLSAGCANTAPQTETTPAQATVSEAGAAAAAETTPSETAAPAPEQTDPAQGDASEAQTNAPNENDGEPFYDGPLNPAVWKVTDPESGNSMHMMGTIHIIPDSDTVVPDYIMELYHAADGIAVEYDTTKLSTDFVLQLQYLSYFTLSDGTTIEDHLSPETLERAGEFFRANGQNPDLFGGYNAAYWESLISSLSIISIPGMRQSGIDVFFIANAKKDGKEVRSIEALETQMNVLTMLSDGFYEWQINELLDEMDADEMEETFRLLYTAWATGDESLFDEASEDEEDMPEEFIEEYEAYNEALCAARNVGMAEKAAEYIRNGDNLLYMVGFAHFCGEGSVLDNLTEMGFTVERIY